MNRKLLILSGPTHEYIDPVRFIGNASSGLMGKALADEAHQRGFRIEFISGPVAEQNLPQNTRLHCVVSAAEMLNKAQELFATANQIIFAAAVADYTPTEKRTEKMAKSDHDLTLQLKATADIAKTLCANKRPEQTAIGFALQTANGEAHAHRKLKQKNLDGIVLNTPASLGASNGCFSFLAAGSDRFEVWGNVDKHECAKRILQQLERLSRGK